MGKANQSIRYRCQDCRYSRRIHAVYERGPIDAHGCGYEHGYPLLRGRLQCLLKDVIIFEEQVGCSKFVRGLSIAKNNSPVETYSV